MMLAKYSTRDQIQKHIEENGIAILPIGACEQHGHHLPMGTDSILAESFSKLISKETGAIVYPPIEFGYSWVWKETPGTVTLSQEVFKKVLKEAVLSLVTSGYKSIILVNGHDSNKMAIKYTIREISETESVKVLNFFYPGMDKAYKKVMKTDTWHGMFHAEEFETSLMLYFNDELVDMSKAVKEYPERPVLYGYDESPLDFLSKSGVYGDATCATKEKGKELIEVILKEALNILKHL